jgi:hypothetical protein
VTSVRSTSLGVRPSGRSRSPARAGSRRLVAIAAGVIVLLLAGLVAARLLTSKSLATPVAEPVPASVMRALTSVPPSNFEAVGRGTANMPTAIRQPVARTADGRPLVTYIGAEYCPFCAAERWPLIVALSRFGQFSGLQLSQSAADDVFPSTPTFTFVGAAYTSQLIAFDAVETAGNVRQNGRYPPLQSLSPRQEQLLRTYDAPPYVPTSSAGAIPFLDVSNLYSVTGASFDPGVLQGRSWETIVASLSQSDSPQARAILGTANVLSAAICEATDSQPAEVCGSPTVQALSQTLSQLPAAGARP